jgi:hypothetical protein
MASGDQPTPTAPRPPRSGFSTKAKAIIATLTAVIGLATGVLTLRDQLFGGDTAAPTATPTGPDRGTVADISNDAEAKSRANRVKDGLKGCFLNGQGADYEECGTAGRLGALHVPIGFGVGQVEVDTGITTFELISRSESGNTFRLMNTAEGEEVRTCSPPGSGGCPSDGRW